MSKKISIHNRAKPGFKSGTYDLAVTHKISGSGIASKEKPVEFIQNQRLFVAGTQFELAPELCYEVMPPPNSSVHQETQALAHIAFRQQTLPWQRSIDQQDSPWLALLVLHETEQAAFALIENQPLSNLSAVSGDAPRYNFEGDTPPGITGADTCTVLRIGNKLFHEIAPLQTELQLLAHLRKMEDPATDEPDTTISVVTANRVGQAGLNHAVLVSLEKMGRILPNHRPEPEELRTLRSLEEDDTIDLVCLHYWSFSVEDDAEHGFLAAAKRLQDQSILQNQPTGNKDIDEVLQQGYIPLPHRLRSGDTTVSWYRGPLVTQVQSNEVQNLDHQSDALESFDEDSGMLNESYAAAWQLGQLLAMKDQGFAQALYRWKEEQENAHQRAKIRQQNLEFLQPLLANKEQAVLLSGKPQEDEEVVQDAIKDALAPILEQLFSHPKSDDQHGPAPHIDRP